jgi:hypothetical protein
MCIFKLLLTKHANEAQAEAWFMVLVMISELFNVPSDDLCKAPLCKSEGNQYPHNHACNQMEVHLSLVGYWC